MIRKAVVGVALMSGLIGSTSAAWAGPTPTTARGGTRAITVSEADSASADDIIMLCGHGYSGVIHTGWGGDISWGWYQSDSFSMCQGAIRQL